MALVTSFLLSFLCRALQQAAGDEIREFQRVREGSERSVLLHERVQNYPGKTGGVKQAEITPASNFLFQQRDAMSLPFPKRTSPRVELCELSPKAAVLSAWLLVKASSEANAMFWCWQVVNQREFHFAAEMGNHKTCAFLQAMQWAFRRNPGGGGCGEDAKNST